MLVCVNGKSCLTTVKNTSDASQFYQTSLSNDRLDCYWASTFNICPSPGWGLTFSSYPWRLNKIAFTPEDCHQISGADPGFFLGGGALVSYSTSTPKKPPRFFFCRIPVVLENRRSSQGGVRTPCTLPLDPPLNMVLPLKNMGVLLNNSEKIWAPPPINSILFCSTPKEILNLYSLLLRNAIVPWVLNKDPAYKRDSSSPFMSRN